MTHPGTSVIPLPHDGTLPNALKTLKKSKISVDGHSEDELVSSALEGRKERLKTLENRVKRNA